MVTLLIALGAFVGYIVAYNTYGKWLAGKIFKLDPNAPVPSVQLNDDKDYVPTGKTVVFGHHFTSIAGTGPIVGPAIAVMWGWLPALLWVLFGSILIGAVHDFGALVVSMRNRGQTVGDIAGRVLNPRVRLLFLFVLFMALTIVLAIFGLVIAAVFKQYPASIFPCVVQVPIAMMIGAWLHRKGASLVLPSILALGIMYLTVVFGNVGVLGAFNTALASWSIFSWVLVLLVYSAIASVIPVWMLLQPRDYINSMQLLTCIGLIMLGLAAAAFSGGAAPADQVAKPVLEIAAPAIQMDPMGAPFIFPFLFITIACGAISGFHCLVSSGTSSKQISCETDAQFVGYGSMLTEGFLATLVILACVAGIGLGLELKPDKNGVTQIITADGSKQTIQATDDAITLTSGDSTANIEAGLNSNGVYVSKDEAGTATVVAYGTTAWRTHYQSWDSAKSLGAKVGAFVDGSANFLKALGIPSGIAIALMGVLVASFAGTTLDTACRLQRYVVQELASTFVKVDEEGKPVGASPFSLLTNAYGATTFAIVLAALMAATPLPGQEWSWDNAGKGALILWPMFGATNQLLGGLAFLVIGFWLWRRSLPVWFIVIPMVFMLIMPIWAMAISLNGWISADAKNIPLIVIAIATIILEIWMIIEAFIAWPKAKGVLEESLPPLPGTADLAGGRSC